MLRAGRGGRVTAVAQHFGSLAELVKKREAGTAPLELQTILLFGNPGTGKTSIAAAFPNHLYLDLEASATNHDITQLDLRTWAQVRDFIEQAHVHGEAFLGDRKTLIIDTVTDLWHLCVKHEFAERKIKEWPEDYGKTLKAVRATFKESIQRLLDLHNRGVMGTVLIAHEETETVKTLTNEFHIRRPMVDDKDIKSFVAAKPQIVVRTFTTDTHPVTGDLLGGTKYLLQTTPINPGDVVKDRSRKLPPFLGATYDNLAEQYAKGGPAPANTDNKDQA